MTEQFDPLSPTEKLNALLSWWGYSGFQNTPAAGEKLAHFQELLENVQQAYDDARTEVFNNHFSMQEELLRLAMQLARSENASSALAAEVGIGKALLDGAMRQAKAWEALVQCIRTCCINSLESSHADLNQQPNNAGSNSTNASSEGTCYIADLGRAANG